MVITRHPARLLNGGRFGALWGGGKGGGSAPTPPDPAVSAAAQAQANKEAVFESARVNQINQVTPFGETRFTGEIGSPERTQTLSLPPEVQAILDQQTGVTGDLTGFAGEFVPRVADSLQNPFNTADLGPAPDFNTGTRERIEQSLFDRLNPQFDRDEDLLRGRLANQGIAQGSEAFGQAFDDFGRFKNDARLASISAAGTEAARDFGLQSQSRQQQLSEALLNRTQGLNEVSALLQGAPAINTPSLSNPAQFQIAPGDFQGAEALNFQGRLNSFNQDRNSRNAALGGLAGLGGSLGGALILSDRRAKTDIRRVGALDSGQNVYTFRYIDGGPVQMGVMAQETPAAAVHDIDGVLHVDYARV